MSSASLCRRVDCEPRHLGNGVPFSLERDDFSSNRHGAPSFCLSMIFSETRYPLFRIMLQSAEPVARSPARRAERLTREHNVHGFKGVPAQANSQRCCKRKSPHCRGLSCFYQPRYPPPPRLKLMPGPP
jgi:hypothetical protein